jgi:hypothetical protein
LCCPLENIEGAIKNGQSRETGNTGHTGRRKTKQKHNTIYIGHHYTQTNKSNRLPLRYSLTLIYGKFGDKGNNPMDNPNIYNVKGDSRRQVSILTSYEGNNCIKFKIRTLYSNVAAKPFKKSGGVKLV